MTSCSNSPSTKATSPSTESIAEDLAALQSELEDLEFRLMLSGEYDDHNAILALHAGAGGVDSQDWVQMLMRMYLRWSEGRGYRTEVLDISPGDEAGIKSVVVQVSGDHAYGYLKAEKGVHRLVRISPFDGNHARHTSFALAEIMPEVEEGADIQIGPDDLKIDTFRAGGHGGQNVQKNSTAIRITHLPTGTRVSCQNERSLRQNREIAMRILMARLVELEMQKKAERMARIKGEQHLPRMGQPDKELRPPSLTRWSRITAWTTPSPTPPPSWTVIWMGSLSRI